MSTFTTYDLETRSTNRARPYKMTFYPLSKIAGRKYCDLTPDELKKCKKDTIAFDGDNYVSNALDFCLKLKREERIVKKIVEYNLQLHAHNGSGFDAWIILNNLACDNHIVDIIENGKRVISLKTFSGYIPNGKRQIYQHIVFRCGLTHLSCSLKK